jgi:hypothetical protein
MKGRMYSCQEAVYLALVHQVELLILESIFRQHPISVRPRPSNKAEDQKSLPMFIRRGDITI